MFAELRRRGVLGAVVAYGVAAAGALQLADIVVHALDFPAWSLRLLIWLAALGLPVTFVVSWFFDLTRNGFVRTQFPSTPRQQSPPPLPPAMVRDFEQGATLAGRYHLKEELGRGAMGRVLVAVDEKLGRRVAVKVVTGAHDPLRIQRFIQEARTASTLDHPNVVSVFDLGEHEGIPFLVTELLEGQPLRGLLREGALPAAQAQDLAGQLARGLAAAHARGIVHRDLKPENLFVTKDGRLKILDFGLARLISDDASQALTQTGAVFGTPGYLSPEQARGEKVGPRSDIFSAGAVLYEMLSGRRAFPGSNLIEAGHAALTKEPDALPLSTPPLFEGVISKALSKEPAKRYADGAELSRALEASTAGAPVPASVGAGNWRRSTALMVALAALALGAALASGLRVIHTSRAPVIVHGGSASQHAVPPAIPRIAPPAPPRVPAGDSASDSAAADDEDETDSDSDEAAGANEAAKASAEAARVGERMAKAITGKMSKKAHYARPGILAGVHAMVNAGQLASAEKMLRRQQVRDPILQLDLFLLLRGQGRTADASGGLREYLKAHPEGEWPAPLLQAYAGTLADDAVLAKVHGDPDDLCDAFYYLGRLHETAKPAVAKAQLQKASGGQCEQAQYAQQALSALQ